MTSVEDLNIKIFADGADADGILEMSGHRFIKGFTTNPTLMRKAGVEDYQKFALGILRAIPNHPISFEVISDEFDEMRRQAAQIARWGANVYVKIPVTNTRAEKSISLISDLARAGIKQNVTAVMTIEQVKETAAALSAGPPCVISVFAGRIADTGRDPVPIMRAALEAVAPHRHIELLWASPRELLNIFQADAIGCHIITATNDILKKLHLVGKDLSEYSLETVKMFRDDALKAGYTL